MRGGEMQVSSNLCVGYSTMIIGLVLSHELLLKNAITCTKTENTLSAITLNVDKLPR